MSSIRRFENLHILLWLIKDTSWLMEFKWLGTLMVVPTIAVAIHIAYLSFERKEIEFYLQLAICFWITANSYWMICEFVERVDLKNYALIPFLLGFISVFMYYYKINIKNQSSE